MTEDLRYPIGKFTAPTAWNAVDAARWRDELAALPMRLRVAIERLDDEQLETPYRDGGWTVRQTVHHVADSHLNMYCRFRLALTEETPAIKPYLEARWAELADARTAPVAPSLAILDGMHARLVALIDAMAPAEWLRGYLHPEHGRTVALWQTAALYAWHGRHHVAHITALRARRGWPP